MIKPVLANYLTTAQLTAVIARLPFGQYHSPAMKSAALCLFFFAAVLHANFGQQSVPAASNPRFAQQSLPQAVTGAASVVQALSKARVGEIASIAAGDRTYIAALVDFDVNDQLFLIYELRHDGKIREVYRETGEALYAPHHGNLTAISGGQIAGFMLMETPGEGWYGRTMVVADVDGKWRRVYKGDGTQVLDLTANGYPVLFESDWPEEGEAKFTTVYGWYCGRFKRLIKVPYPQRFGARVRGIVQKNSPYVVSCPVRLPKP